MKILGIDPGMNRIGWAVLDKARDNSIKYIGSGLIKTDTKDEKTKKLAYIFTEVEKIILEYKPEIVSIEEVFVNTNARSSLILGFARGAILASIGVNNLQALEYAPNTIKKTIVGNGKAEKEQVMKMLKLVIPNIKFSSSDEADAIAIAYTGIVSRVFVNNT